VLARAHEGGGWRGPNGGEERGEGAARPAEMGQGRGAGPLYLFLFIPEIVFPFYLLHLIQIQMCHKFKLTPSSICIKQK
jgi:hypothetical protein